MTAGNNIGSAQLISLNPSVQTFTDSVQFGLPDFYSFVIPGSSSSSSTAVSITLSGLTADANLAIFNSPDPAAAPIDASNNTGTLVDVVNTLLIPGTYYIRVTPGAPSDPTNPAGTTPATPYSLNFASDNGIRADIAWFNVATNQTSVWSLSGINVNATALSTTVQGAGWRLQTTGDFNGDGNSDFVWRNSNGQNAVWFMDGTTVLSTAFFDSESNPAWEIRGAGDFDGDGRTDLLWQNTSSKDVSIWFMNGTNAVSKLLVTPRPGPFEIQGAGDFNGVNGNGDGRADIIWRNTTTGENDFWFMNGVTVIGTAPTVPVPATSGWQIRGSADYNQDGKADLFWRNTITGENSVWFMDGTNQLGTVVLAPTESNTDWQPLALSGRRSPVPLRDIAGNTIPRALNIGSLDGFGTYRSAITTTNPADYYQFTLPTAGRVGLTFGGASGGSLAGDLDLFLSNSTGTLTQNLVQTALTPETLTANLPAGTYTVRIAPKGTAVSSYQLGLTILPTLVSNSPLTINEGAIQTISSSSLLVSEGSKAPSLITYSIIAAPSSASGNLSLGGTALFAGSTFTQADINAGRLAYRQNGSETPLNDSFTFGVSTGSGGLLPTTIAPTVFSLNFVPSNDPPVLLSTNLSITLTEGVAAAITSTLLSAIDTEQAPAQLVYSIASAPTNGTILRNGLPLVGGTFTQADVNDGTLLSYSHNGSEAVTDGFTFVLSDGAGGILPSRSLRIAVIGSDDAPVLISNTGITLSEFQSQVLATSLLTATDIDTVNPDLIVYSVVSPPSNGVLARGGTLSPISTFTQGDLNNGRIVYGHNRPQTNTDTFTFTVSNPGGPVGEVRTFNVSVTGVNFIPEIATNAGLTLSEGTIAALTTTLLQVSDADSAAPQLTYSLLTAPANGSITRVGFGTLSTGSTFTQLDLDTEGRMNYVHNGGESASDRFIFSVTDQGGARLNNQTFSISVLPTNDAPTLVSNVGLTAVEGTSVRIATSLLSASDVDTPVAQLVYSITSAPTNGTLQLAQSTLGLNSTFTQADINGGLLSYRQNGSETLADSFGFALSDGVAPEIPGLFTIGITPLNDLPTLGVTNPGFSVAEGTPFILTRSELFVNDVDGPETSPIFTLASLPTAGTLLLGGVGLSLGSTFTQSDIDNSQVSYQNNGSETSRDRFTFTASDGSPTGQIPVTPVSITVINTNDAPTLVSLPTSVTANEDTNFTFNGLNRIRTTDPDSTTLTATLAVNSGTLGLSAAGVTVVGNNSGNVVVSGTTASLNTALNTLIYRGLANFNGEDTLTVLLSDGDLSTTGTVSINVAPVNDAPTLTVPGVQSVAEDLSLSFANLFTFSDIDAGTTPENVSLSVTNGTLTVGSFPSLQFLGGDPVAGSNTLSFSGTAEDIQLALNSLVYTGRSDFNGSDRLTISVNDNGTPTPLSVTRTVPITVTAVNDAPTFTAGPDVISVNEDSPAFSQLWATGMSRGGGTDEASQTLSFLVANDNSSIFTATGQPRINTTTGALTFALSPNANTSAGPVTVTVNLRDGGNGTNISSASTFTINVNPVNDAPTFVIPTSLRTVTVAEDAGPQSLQLVTASSISAGPNEVGQNLTFGLEQLSTTNEGLFLPGSEPTLDPATGRLVYQTAPDASGRAIFRATLSDDGGTDNGFGATGVDRTSQTFTINVTAVNDAPVLTIPVGPLNIDEDTRLFIPDITVTDADAGTTNLRVTLSAASGNLSLGTAPTGVTVTGNNSRTVVLAGSQAAIAPVLSTLSYQTTANFAGPTDTLTIRATDAANAAAVTQSLAILVNPVNDAPTLTVSPATLTAQEDVALNIGSTVIRGTDIDTGSVTVTVTSTNGGTLSLGGVSGTSITTLIAASTLTTGLAGLSYRGAQDYNGPDTLTVTVDDGAGGIVDRSLSVNVVAVNDAPVLTVNPAAIQPVPEGTPIFFSGDTLNVTDVDSARITVGLAVQNGTVTLGALDGLTVVSGTNGSARITYAGAPDIVNSVLSGLTYNPNAFYNGADTLTITATDGVTPAPVRTLSLTVTPVNDPPVLTRNLPLAALEGNTASSAVTVISTSLLSATDPDSPAASTLVYSVTAAPTNGILQRSGTGPAITSFTQADLTAGVITYAHNGSETTEDSFVFQLTDGNPATALPPTVFNINVTPLNDVPVLTTPNPTISVSSTNRTVTLNLAGGSTNQLTATDVDTPPTELVYRVDQTSLPTFGNLQRSGVTLGLGSTFTQADLNNGLVTYNYVGASPGNANIVLRLSDDTTSFSVTVLVRAS